jgi:diketogulonate reductase-like aldo/keto reductase
MEYFTLNNGVQMPIIGFGTWDVRGAEGERCILDALEVGYCLIDTVKMYGNE